jgi:predicted nucleic acid-binding protein
LWRLTRARARAQTRPALGQSARTSLLAEVASGAYQLEPFSGPDTREALAVIRRHDGLGVSLADASIAVLAGRHKIQDVLTLDERHFRTLTANGRPFRLLPADA